MKSGFVAIIGRPNVGKSSLLNATINYEVSIVTPTAQTTRDKIKGIYTDDEMQIVFLDTPGIHKPIQKLGKSLNEKAYSSVSEADITLFLHPIDEKIGKGDLFLISKINLEKSIAVITKIDLEKDFDKIEKRAKEFKDLNFKTVVAVSTSDKKSIESFLDTLKEILPIGVQYYEEDQVSDVSMRFIAKEIIREAAIKATRDEIPHSIGVVIDEFNESDEEKIHIAATLYVERESQKGIVIGAHAEKIKKIGTEARIKMNQSFGTRVHIDLSVKVKKNWTNDDQEIKKMGY